MARQIDGIALGAVAAGSLFLYAGLTGRNIPQSLQALIQGQSPASVPAGRSPFGTGGSTSAGNVSGGSASGQALAVDALAYQGHCYVLGGAPGRDGKGCWDCSSAVNWWVGHDMGMAIPGGKGYDGTSHGPNSFTWALWGGLRRVKRSEIQAGDILIWTSGEGHIGIAISNMQMVSALNPQLGTAVTAITDTARGVFLPFRLKALAAAPPPGNQRKKG